MPSHSYTSLLMKICSCSESNGAMLVPSTFTGWYKNTMMTSAKPMAISKSRVHTRISWRKESSDAGGSEEVFGEILTQLFEFTLDAMGFSSECSISLPRIYNMSIAERARFRFDTAACAATPPAGAHWFDAGGCLK